MKPYREQKQQDAALLQDILARYLETPETLDYSTDVAGASVDADVLKKHKGLILELVDTYYKKGGLVHSVAQEALAALAKSREGEWALSKDIGDWSEDTAKMIRCMLRQVSNALSRTPG